MKYMNDERQSLVRSSYTVLENAVMCSWISKGEGLSINKTYISPSVWDRQSIGTSEFICLTV